MTHRTKEGMLVIAVEEDDICELCGKKGELRPYGPNGERICFECGMKDEKTTMKQLQRLFDGKEIEKKVRA